MEKDLRIKKTSAADLVCARMREMVIDGTWPVNEKIPSEGKLAETFGVNRLTVRNALQRLNALGVLKTHVGDGTYVVAFDFDKHLSDIADFYVTGSVVDATMEFRSIIETAAARLAVERCKPRDLEAMKACCEAFEEEVARFYTLTDSRLKHESFLKTVDIGLAFHTELFRMAGNELLLLSFSLAKEPVRRHMARNAALRINDPKGHHSSVWVKAYWGVCRAIEAGDAEACCRELKKLIELKA